LKSTPATILVTGGAGYIGSHVVKALGAGGYDVVVYDNLSTGYAWAVRDANLVEADLADGERLAKTFRRHAIDTVLHFAASIEVAESVSNPLKYYINNTANTFNLLAACARFKVRRFVFSSTCAVYGTPKKMPIDESVPLAPVSPYAASKAASERALIDLAQISDLRFVILRYFNVAGADPSGMLGECHEPESHLIPLACRAALGRLAKFSIFGDDYKTKDGTCIRDYIHVTDLAQAHVDALEFLDREARSDIFNCGYGTGYSVRQIIDTVKRISGEDFPVTVSPRRSGDLPELVAANAKIIDQLGWTPRHDDLNGIVKSALDWERQRPDILARESAANAKRAGFA
jgi:UDP-glucose 4-epimerase